MRDAVLHPLGCDQTGQPQAPVQRPIASFTQRATERLGTSRSIVSSAFSFRSWFSSARSLALNRPSPPSRARRSFATQLPSVPSLIPSSRATCAIGLLDSRTIRTAPSRNSASNVRRVSTIAVPPQAMSPRYEGKPTPSRGFRLRGRWFPVRKSTTRRGFGVRRPGLGVLLAGLAVGVGVVSLGVGASEVSWRELGEVLVGGGDAGTRLVVLELRLPRIVTGLLVGVAFAVSGALLQTLARNPLASPDVLGVSAGASAAAVSVLVLAGSAGGISGLAAAAGLPVAATAGGLATTALVAVLASNGPGPIAARRGVARIGGRVGGGGFDAGRVVLVGIGVSAAANSVVSWLLVIGDVNDASRAAAWLAGSLN